MADLFTAQALGALFQVVMIDLVLAGDNAVVIGLAASGLPPEQRRTAILTGILGATLLRIGLAGVTTQLLQVVGLLLAGGILLLWVCWRMWRELSAAPHHEVAGRDLGATAPARDRKPLGRAIRQIIVADVSMSLDNVLAVAGAAREQPAVLVFGLALSIALMGLAASWIATLLEEQRWLAYVGLAIVLYVAGDMIVRGAGEVLGAHAGTPLR
jgi:YjbE family integral membrane protein